MQEIQSYKLLEPEMLFNQVDIKEGWRCADFGCGGGHFSFELARRVGGGGTVHALDILPEALEAIESHAKVENFQNILTKRVNLEKVEGTGLDAESLDFILLKDVLFQNKDKKVILEEVKRVLKSNGIMIVVEWDPGNSTIGPEVAMRVSGEELKSVFQEAGLRLEKDLEAGDYHNAFLVRK